MIPTKDDINCLSVTFVNYITNFLTLIINDLEVGVVLRIMYLHHIIVPDVKQLK